MTPAVEVARRRQFLLGPRRLPLVRGWRTVEVGDDLLLEAHPDLKVTQAHTGDRHLTLLGFIVDPTDPARSDDEILAGLAADIQMDALGASTDRFGGRWALLADIDGQTIVFTDAAGLRQVYHAASGSGAVWAASQSAFLAQVLDLPVDPEAAEFAGSLYFASYLEPWWPVTRPCTRELAACCRITSSTSARAWSAASGRSDQRVTCRWPMEPNGPPNCSEDRWPRPRRADHSRSA